MPELPEVETVKRGLLHEIMQKPKVKRLVFLRPDLRFPLPLKQVERLRQTPFLDIRRRAKYLIFSIGSTHFISHLGMTGTWRVEEKREPQLHDHIEIWLDTNKVLVYRDPRRFGFFIELKDENKYFKDLGPEPLDEQQFQVEPFLSRLRKSSAPIKAAIMDQKVVVGVGNIYACEALFRAQISPKKIARRLTREQVERLVHEIRSVLSEAIEAGGSSISDFYSAQKQKGDFQNRFWVYDREGLDCRRCGQKVKRIVQSGRSTFYCSKCQRS